MAKVKIAISPKSPQHPEALWDYIRRVYVDAYLRYISPSGVIFVECSEDTAKRMKLDPTLNVTEVAKIKLSQNPLQEAPTPASVEIWPNTIAKRLGPAIAWEAGFRGEGTTVAVLDSGINPHQTLKGKIAYEEALVTETTLDEFGHGTCVASIIAGEDTATGFTGIAPKTTIYNIKMLNERGESDEETAVKAVDRAVELNVDVINISWGLVDTGNPNEPIRIAVRNASKNKIIVVAAAGNFGPTPSTISSPATDPEAVAVGSCTASEIVSEFSSRGPTKEGIVKPEGLGFGENVVAADPRTASGLVKVTGTSYTTPQGSGIAALGKQIFRPYIDREWIEKGLKYSSTKPPTAPAPKTVKDNVYGYGTPDFRIYGSVTIPGAPTTIHPDNILNLILLAILTRIVG